MVPSQTGVQNSRRLFLGGFLTLVTAGMAFSSRGAVLGIWGAKYGFTKAELGVITGFGVTGFGVTMMFFSVLVERWGYGILLALTFAFHLLSSVIYLAAGPVFQSMGKDAAFWCLSGATTMVALGNAASEAAINPLVAALHPSQRTHRLNILHAGYPGGLILGALLGVLLASQRWELILLTYAAPTILYGALLFGQAFPASQAQIHNMRIGAMARQFASPVLIGLLVLMAMVGFVELGTDSWIANITGTLLTDPKKGLYLFIWTSSLMFALRFCAGPIVHRISPLGLLFGSACFGALGLYLLGEAGAGFSVGGPVLAFWLAATVYAIGKTFYWPTMLGVAAERFPKGGALTIGAVGCIGALSAGLHGGPVIGFMQDYYASEDLQRTSVPAYQRYRADTENSLLIFHTRGLDGSKVAVLTDDGQQLATDLEALRRTHAADEHLDRLRLWWDGAKNDAKDDSRPVKDATLYGGRMALKRTSLVPILMALGYLLLILHFRARGGYTQIQVEPIRAESGGGGPQHAGAAAGREDDHHP